MNDENSNTGSSDDKKDLQHEEEISRELEAMERMAFDVLQERAKERYAEEDVVSGGEVEKENLQSERELALEAYAMELMLRDAPKRHSAMRDSGFGAEGAELAHTMEALKEAVADLALLPFGDPNADVFRVRIAECERRIYEIATGVDAQESENAAQKVWHRDIAPMTLAGVSGGIGYYFPALKNMSADAKEEQLALVQDIRRIAAFAETHGEENMASRLRAHVEALSGKGTVKRAVVQMEDVKRAIHHMRDVSVSFGVGPTADENQREWKEGLDAMDESVAYVEGMIERLGNERDTLLVEREGFCNALENAIGLMETCKTDMLREMVVPSLRKYVEQLRQEVNITSSAE